MGEYSTNDFCPSEAECWYFLFLDFQQQLFVRKTNCESFFCDSKSIQNDVSLSFGLIFFIHTKIALTKWMSKRTRTHTQRQENHRSELIISYIFFCAFYFVFCRFASCVMVLSQANRVYLLALYRYIEAGICCIYSGQNLSDAARNVLLCTHTEWYMNNVWNERVRFGFISQLLMYQ